LRKTVKKVLAGILAAALSFGSAVPAFAADSPTTSKTPAAQTGVAAEGKYYVGNTTSTGTVSITTTDPSTKDTKTIPTKLTINGVSYTVTTLESNALSNLDTVKTVILPPTLTTIKKQAFTGCKSLKTIVLKNKKATKVQKNAFKGLNTKKITVKVKVKMSDKNYKKLQKQLRKAGFKGKIKRVKK
jgi:hypothetical protein